MKTRINFSTLFILFVFSSISLAQDYPHIPPSHNHSGGICWGYAMARAFGRSNNHAVCSAVTVNVGEIASAYFQQNGWNIFQVQEGDIIDFTKPNQQHVAYVADIIDGDGNPDTRTNDDIILDQVENATGAFIGDRTLQQTINGTNGIYEPRGNPTSFWVLQPKFKMVVRNKLGDNSNGGQVGFDSGEFNSPYQTAEFHWETSHTLNAVMDGQTHGLYVQRFEDWKQNLTQIATIKIKQITINWNSGQPTFEANLLNEYDLVFLNYFTGVSSAPGIIKVNNNPQNSPHTIKVKHGYQVGGEAVSQTFNHIDYTFSQWGDGITSASRTITASGIAIYVATFAGKPRAMTNYNLHISSNPGEYISFSWNQHGNPNVQYKVWRRVKPQGGSIGPEELKATLNHNVTSWTDYEYIMTSGYTVDLLEYDVRAYYTVEGTSANPDYITVFGEGGIIKASVSTGEWAYDTLTQPANYNVSAFPNPFNPATNLNYQLEDDAEISLSIFDAHGRLVKTLVAGGKKAGYYGIRWNGAGEANNKVASGIYFYQLIARPVNGKEPFRKSGKLLLTR